MTVRHRVSIPDFERFLGGDEASKDKPLNAYINVADDAELGSKVQTLLRGLLEGEQHDPVVLHGPDKNLYHYAVITRSNSDFAQRVIAAAGVAGELTPVFTGRGK